MAITTLPTYTHLLTRLLALPISSTLLALFTSLPKIIGIVSFI